MRHLRAAVLLLLMAGCAPTAAPLPPAPAPTPTPQVPPVSFPRDADPHDALTEWWYYTGHLRAADGREFGFELTFFQSRRQDTPTGYLAHFAVTDIAGQRFSHQARFAQAEAATSLPLQLGDWRLSRGGGASEVIEARMQPGPGADPPYGLQLTLIDERPAALHHGGYIDLGPLGGSYYYSRTRLRAAGALEEPGKPSIAVEGQAWMDHQWGNFVVAGDGGWDWYSLQLDDGADLMLYVLRGMKDETTTVYGTLVQPDGSTRDLAQNEVHIETLGTWTSPHTRATYPSGWLITLPSGERMKVQPRVLDQELYFPESVPSAVYWEGAVSVEGDRTGLGYVELTGYAAN